MGGIVVSALVLFSWVLFLSCIFAGEMLDRDFRVLMSFMSFGEKDSMLNLISGK
jgi:hypothetical protein